MSRSEAVSSRCRICESTEIQSGNICCEESMQFIKRSLNSSVPFPFPLLRCSLSSRSLLPLPPSCPPVLSLLSLLSLSLSSLFSSHTIPFLFLFLMRTTYSHFNRFAAILMTHWGTLLWQMQSLSSLFPLLSSRRRQFRIFCFSMLTSLLSFLFLFLLRFRRR